MNVFHVAFECAPIFKTGGLGDVVGSLPKVLSAAGVNTSVIMPGYSWIKRRKHLPGVKVPVHYVESPFFSERKIIRGSSKDKSRAFADFAIKTLEYLKHINQRPDIIHCHDWHTGLIPLLVSEREDAFFEHTRTLLTIHNIAYKGTFAKSNLQLPEFKELLSLLDSRQKNLSFLDEGIKHADFVSTVSENHALEIRDKGLSFGSRKYIAKLGKRFVGIVNGIDYQVWNPRTDRNIIYNYGLSNVFAEKIKNKELLQKMLKLPVNSSIPVFGFIARLSHQKGIEHLISLVKKIATLDIQLIILGTGDDYFEAELRKLKKKKYKSKVSITLKFDEKLAHRIYAGADFFLIPSRYEPCGLTQMISMAYGTLPVASQVGGLIDTIKHDETGILFHNQQAEGFKQAINHAYAIYRDKQKYEKMVKKAIKENFSWRHSASEYVKLYHKVISA